MTARQKLKSVEKAQETWYNILSFLRFSLSGRDGFGEASGGGRRCCRRSKGGGYILVMKIKGERQCRVK